MERRRVSRPLGEQDCDLHSQLLFGTGCAEIRALMRPMTARSTDEAPVLEVARFGVLAGTTLVEGTEAATFLGQLKGLDDPGIETGCTPTFVTLLTTLVLTLAPTTVPTPI